MRIAYITTYDPENVRHWSGLGFFIRQAFEKNGFDVVPIGPLHIDRYLLFLLKARGLWHNKLRRRRYMRSHDALVGRRFARQADARLAAMPDIDLIFSPGAIPVAYLEDPRPLVTWSDATHAAIFDYYPEYSNLSEPTRRDGHEIERRALARSTAAIFCSDWAARSAIDFYKVPESRVHMIPFGANLENPPGRDEVQRLVEARPTDRCRLLFAGVDWHRKGGPLVLETARLLNQRGLKTELTIVGCDPFGADSAPSFVDCRGFIAKDTEAGRAELGELFGSHHFLFVPSRAECFGLVYCEAGAYGTPALACDTGGVSTAIHSGENGLLLPVDAPAPAYADAIATTFADYGRYRAMAAEARRHFEQRLNWDVAGRRAAEVLRRAAAAKPHPSR